MVAIRNATDDDVDAAERALADDPSEANVLRWLTERRRAGESMTLRAVRHDLAEILGDDFQHDIKHLKGLQVALAKGDLVDDTTPAWLAAARDGDLQDLAREFDVFFVRRLRPGVSPQSGDQVSRDNTFTTLNEARPEELHDLVEEVHGDRLPDDWTFEFIQEAMTALSEHEDPDDIQLGPDTGLLAWLSSALDRPDIVDEVREEFSLGDQPLLELIGAGQLREKEEVLGIVRQQLEEIIEAREGEEDDDDDEEDDE